MPELTITHGWTPGVIGDVVRAHAYAREWGLRWFITIDAARGRGVGRRLMTAADAFLKQAGFESCLLTTFADLAASSQSAETRIKNSKPRAPGACTHIARLGW